AEAFLDWGKRAEWILLGQKPVLAHVGIEQIDHAQPGPDLLKFLGRLDEKRFQTRRLQVPINQHHIQASAVQPMSHVGQSHGPAYPAFVGIKREDHYRRIPKNLLADSEGSFPK